MTILDRHSTARDVLAGHDLTAKYILVTGATSGLGLETARAFAAAGARLLLPVRNFSAGRYVADRLARETGNDRIEVRELDLASLASVRQFARTVLDDASPLHVLINNAAVMATPHTYTVNGYELQFGTNHLGHFLLTLELLPALRAARGARVVNVSSSVHSQSGVDFDDPNYRVRTYNKWHAYAQSKTAVMLFGIELTRRYGAENIHANAVNPGGILTPLQRHLSREEMLQIGFIDAHGQPASSFRTPEQGAAPSVWAAVAPELEGVGGRYLVNYAIAGPWDATTNRGGAASHATSEQNAERLWELSERFVRP